VPMTEEITRSSGDNVVVAHAKGWWEGATGFFKDVRMEMKKVTTPSQKEVRATTIVVIITVFIFAAYFWMVDLVIGRGMVDQFYRWITHRT